MYFTDSILGGEQHGVSAGEVRRAGVVGGEVDARARNFDLARSYRVDEPVLVSEGHAQGVGR